MAVVNNYSGIIIDKSLIDTTSMVIELLLAYLSILIS